METLKLILFVSVVAFTMLAGAFCLIVGGYALFTMKSQGRSKVQIGKHFSIDTTFPALVLCFFGVILFLSVGWLVNSKLTIAQLQSTVSAQDSQLAELKTTAAAQNTQVAELKGVLTETEATSPKECYVGSSLLGILTGGSNTTGNLIARNHEGIEQLKLLGERDYVEFTVDKVNIPQKIDGLTFELLEADPKTNQYSARVVLNDKAVEKKSQGVNEPIVVPADSSRPLEVVVNKVGSNEVAGYVSMPKTPLMERALVVPHDK